MILFDQVMKGQQNLNEQLNIIISVGIQLYVFLKSMYSLIYRPTVTEIIFCIIIGSVYVFLLFKFIALYFQYKIVASCLLILITLLLLVRAIGLFIMYPGTYNYLNANLLNNQTDFLLLNIHKDLRKLQNLCSTISKQQICKINKKCFEFYDSELFNSITSQFRVIGKADFKNPLRLRILQLYTELINLLSKQIEIQKFGLKDKKEEQKQYQNLGGKSSQINIPEPINNSQNSISIQKTMKNPQIFKNLIQERAISQIRQISQQIYSICQKLWNVIVEFSKIKQHKLGNESGQNQTQSPLSISSWKTLNWFLFSQKLFTMDSYYVFWDNVFQYQTMMVEVQKGLFIQCAIIHGEKNQKTKITEHKRAVLFNNPNGAILQTLALTSSYINFYLKWGFQIVLWNYRGYGKSNGFSSSRNSISDVQKVYQYVTKNFSIKIEVIHGYSIGGISAISLSSGLSMSDSSPIKLLIADRTFSSIDRVAEGFLNKRKKLLQFLVKLGRKVVKLLLWSECVNNALTFRLCRCQKIVIHDIYDQIINEQGSMRKQLLKQALSNQQDTLQQSNRSDEQLQEVKKVSLKKIREIVDKFTDASYKLYAKGKTNYERVMKIIYDTDGAGLQINLHSDIVLQNGNNRRTKQEIVSESTQYIIGLIIYGPKLNSSYFESLGQEEKQTRQRLQQRIKLMLRLSQKTQGLTDKDSINVIIECLKFACQMHDKPYSTIIREQFGHLIVSKAGHNGQLKNEYYRLETVLKSIYDLK